jgi:predicted ester cyclase
LYPHRQLHILNLVAQADQVVLEQDWQGTAAATFGGVSAGTTVRFRVASFFRLVDGLIIKQTDYGIPIPEQGAMQ